MRISTKEITQTKTNCHPQLTIHYKKPDTNEPYADNIVIISQIQKAIKKKLQLILETTEISEYFVSCFLK
jgi:hypothetical protein